MTGAWRVFALLAGAGLAGCASFGTPTPPSAASYADLLIGRVANLQQDYSAAANRYSEALRRDPRNPTLIEGAVTMSLAAGDLDGARRAARLAPREDAPPYVSMVRAVDALNAGRARQAEAELNRVDAGAVEELQKRVLLVWAGAAQNDVDDAIAALTPLASIRPYGGLFSYQQAMALDLIGRSEEATRTYDTASREGLFLPPAVVRHADLLIRTGAADEARAVLSDERNHTNPEIAAAAARVEGGSAASSTPLTAARGAAIGLYGLAAIFSQEHETTNTLATLTLALALDDDLNAARLMFAQEQDEAGNVQLARRALDDIPDASPYAASARVTQAFMLMQAGQEEDALTIARTNAASGDLRAQRQLADLYRAVGQYEEANTLYGALIAAVPDDWRLYFARGATLERLQRWDEAEADFRHALELSPDQPEVLNYLGYSWVDRGVNLQEGLAMLQRAAALRPQSGAILDSLGWAYYRLGDYPLALNYVETAVQFEPSDPTLNDHLGDIYWRLDRRIEARFQWQRALSNEPDDAAAIQAKIDNGLPPAPAPRSVRR